MSVHKLEIVAHGGELRLELRCTATKGADCRQRPIDDRESWNVGDPGLVDGDCWAVDYIAAGGFADSVFMYEDGVVASVPVNVDYDEAVNLSLALEDIPLEGLSLADGIAAASRLTPTATQPAALAEVPDPVGVDTETHWANGERRLLTPAAFERLRVIRRGVGGS